MFQSELWLDRWASWARTLHEPQRRQNTRFESKPRLATRVETNQNRWFHDRGKPLCHSLHSVLVIYELLFSLFNLYSLSPTKPPLLQTASTPLFVLFE